MKYRLYLPLVGAALGCLAAAAQVATTTTSKIATAQHFIREGADLFRAGNTNDSKPGARIPTTPNS